MDLKLKGKRALITGATRGMGRAIAETLAGEGCNLSICARKEKEVAATVESLQAKGITAYGAAVDVTRDAEVKDWVAKSAEQLGGLDMIVSNVGAMDLGTGRDSWEKNFNLDVMGLVNLVDSTVDPDSAVIAALLFAAGRGSLPACQALRITPSAVPYPPVASPSELPCPR